MSAIIKGSTGDWEIVIGLEVHAQIISNSKLMSSSPANFGEDANVNVSFVDAAFPGMLPVVNKECIRQAVRTGLALGSEINKKSVFARKNYFYADLPQGYQISQADKPTVGEGIVTIDLEDGTSKEIGVERLHVEQDAGKSIHDQHPEKSYIDLNRSGVGLMEIVSKPDIRSADEAAAYFTKIQTIVQYIGSCDGIMARGSMRADVNVSVRRVGETEFGTRTECKNINSVRFIKQAIMVEATRQVELLENGGVVDQETRLFDPDKGETRTMRSKEDAHDYRYFTDPDLLPVVIDDAFIDDCKKSLPELPDAKKERFISEFGLSSYDASVLVADKESALYFEKVADGVKNKKLAANWVISELFGALKKEEKEITECPIMAENLAEMIGLIEDDTISGKIAKEVFADMFATGKKAGDIVEEKGLKQITDTGAIEAVIDEVIAGNPDQVAKAKENPKLMGWFVGQVMQKTGGKANPGAVNKILAEKLK
ncbi:MAG: Asp-tRNA(Asn)/Glu-tRNA(Gln) amidotransferase subunit GatB [Alphaproteobacteria bacterium]